MSLIALEYIKTLKQIMRIYKTLSHYSDKM